MAVGEDVGDCAWTKVAAGGVADEGGAAVRLGHHGRVEGLVGGAGSRQRDDSRILAQNAAGVVVFGPPAVALQLAGGSCPAGVNGRTRNFGSVLIGIQTTDARNFEQILAGMREIGFEFRDITDDQVLAEFLI